MPGRTSIRGALLALALGCLLFLPTHDGTGSLGTAVPSPTISGAPLAAPRPAPVHPATYGARMAGQSASISGHRLISVGASGITQLAERVASLTDRTSSGPGDQLALEPVVSGLSIPAPLSPRSERAVIAACNAPQDTCPARAPPEV